MTTNKRRMPYLFTLFLLIGNSAFVFTMGPGDNQRRSYREFAQGFAAAIARDPVQEGPASDSDDSVPPLVDSFDYESDEEKVNAEEQQQRQAAENLEKYMVAVKSRRSGRKLTRRVSLSDLDKREKEMHGSCSICFEEILNAKELIQLDCTHSFHQNCFLPYLAGRAASRHASVNCPLCRGSLGDHLGNLVDEERKEREANFQQQAQVLERNTVERTAARIARQVPVKLLFECSSQEEASVVCPPALLVDRAHKIKRHQLIDQNGIPLVDQNGNPQYRIDVIVSLDELVKYIKGLKLKIQKLKEYSNKSYNAPIRIKADIVGIKREDIKFDVIKSEVSYDNVKFSEGLRIDVDTEGAINRYINSLRKQEQQLMRTQRHIQNFRNAFIAVGAIDVFYKVYRMLQSRRLV